METVVEILRANAELGCRIVRSLSARLPAAVDCECHGAARFAVITAPEAISPQVRARLRTLYGKYWD